MFHRHGAYGRRCRSGNAPVAVVPVPDEEPSAEDVRRLSIEKYERLESAGSLPMTVTTTTGQSMVFHSKAFDAHKASCHRLPGAKPGEWGVRGRADDGHVQVTAIHPPKGLCQKASAGIRWDSAQRRFTLDD